MSSLYEIVNFDTHTPFRCIVHHIGHIPPHMHDYFEILFVLSGSCSIMIEDQLSQLYEEDVLIIESHIVHELQGSDCVYASVQLDQTTLENNFPVPMHPRFECSSKIPGKEEALGRLRRTIAEMIRNNADKQSGYELRNWILVYQLMDILYTFFRVERSEALDKRSHRYTQRISEISHIINEHFREDLPLSKVADLIHLSVPYLSKFFTEQFGMNYLTYLTQIRLNHAVHELMNTDRNIEEVSSDSGFPNSHAFTTAFRKEYGVMPSVYRRDQKNALQKDSPEGLQHTEHLANLKKYLQSPSLGVQEAAPSLTEQGRLSAASPGRRLLHTWKSVISVGKAADILISDVQKLLKRVRKEIGFRYVFFNGIFSDEMFVYSRNADNQDQYNFVYADRILDFLSETGLLPFLSFSYMPSALARDPGHVVFGHLLSEPSDLDRWARLTEAFMGHVIRRYGRSCVSQWKFCVWHQPDTPSDLYGFRRDEDFRLFYQATRSAVKRLLPEADFGTPAFHQNAGYDGFSWISGFLSWCGQNDCMPDFLNFTYYDIQFNRQTGLSRDTFGFVSSMALNSRPDGLKTFISRIRGEARNLSRSPLPVFISEWNHSPSQQDLLNDTCFKSCYLVKNILENYDLTDSLSYWTLTDLMSERALPDQVFFGGLGLFTVNGLPKAAYQAMKLLSRLNGRLLARGDRWTAVLDDNGDILILACYYIHFSELYASGEQFIMTARNRYTMFETAPPLDLKITIDDLVEGEYHIEEYLTGRRAGSLFDVWEESGAIDPSSRGGWELLESRSVPSLAQSRLHTEGGSLSCTIRLDPLDVKLVLLHPL